MWHCRFTVNPIQAQWEYVEYFGARREDSCSLILQSDSLSTEVLDLYSGCLWVTHPAEKKRESEPWCKAKRWRHSAALGLNDERRWVDLESVDNTTAGLENSNQLAQHNSEDSWQTVWTDGAIFTEAMTHNGGGGCLWTFLVPFSLNQSEQSLTVLLVSYVMKLRSKFTEQLLHFSVRYFSTKPLFTYQPYTKE